MNIAKNTKFSSLNDSIIFRGKEADFDELSSGEKTRAELSEKFKEVNIKKIMEVLSRPKK